MEQINKIGWCCKQNKGIKLIEPNDNISNEYMKEANQTLGGLEPVSGKWKIIMAYYSCYNALYSILMKSGISSEIHDCSIALMNLINGFSQDDVSFMQELKGNRIEVQYYLKDKSLEDISLVKGFILKCKQISHEIQIEELRGKISKIIKGDKN